MNNEPVAYIDPYDLERLPHYDCHIGSQQLKNGIPLYTHPVKDKPHPKCDEACMYLCQMRELTDEEIISTMVQFDVYSSDDHCLIEAGRAILRKAQE